MNLGICVRIFISEMIWVSDLILRFQAREYVILTKSNVTKIWLKSSCKKKFNQTNKLV